MDRRRLLRFLLVAGVVAGLQIGAVLLYRHVEAGRAPSDRPALQTALEYESLPGTSAADLRLERADGRIVRLDDLRGRWVLVHFWATWCPPCRQELPALIDLTRSLSAGQPVPRLELLAVSVQEPWASIHHFFDDKAPDEVFRDAGEDHRTFGVTTLPDTFLVNPSGRLVARLQGARAWASPDARLLLEAAMRGELTGQRSAGDRVRRPGE